MIKMQMLVTRFDLNKRAHAQIMEKIHRDTMVRQQYERLPKHFTKEAFSEYNYHTRSTRYEARKARNVISKANAGLPNVYSGRLRRAVFRKIKITATQHKGRLQTAGATGSHKLTNWQRREIEQMSPKEIALEKKRQAREYKRWATSEKYARKRTRRTKA